MGKANYPAKPTPTASIHTLTEFPFLFLFMFHRSLEFLTGNKASAPQEPGGGISHLLLLLCPSTEVNPLSTAPLQQPVGSVGGLRVRKSACWLPSAHPSSPQHRHQATPRIQRAPGEPYDDHLVPGAQLLRLLALLHAGSCFRGWAGSERRTQIVQSRLRPENRFREMSVSRSTRRSTLHMRSLGTRGPSRFLGRATRRAPGPRSASLSSTSTFTWGPLTRLRALCSARKADCSTHTAPATPSQGKRRENWTPASPRASRPGSDPGVEARLSPTTAWSQPLRAPKPASLSSCSTPSPSGQHLSAAFWENP